MVNSDMTRIVRSNSADEHSSLRNIVTDLVHKHTVIYRSVCYLRVLCRDHVARYSFKNHFGLRNYFRYLHNYPIACSVNSRP